MAWFSSKTIEPVQILGETPNGGPGSDTAPALRAVITPDRVEEVLRGALQLILSATGPRDGAESEIDVSSFDAAIRSFMPLGHYERSPNQAISVMDYKMFACRAVHRLLNQISGRKIVVGGAYNSHLAVNARAAALYDALLDLAAEHQVEDFVPRGWSVRLAAAREKLEAVRAKQEREAAERAEQAEREAEMRAEQAARDAEKRAAQARREAERKAAEADRVAGAERQREANHRAEVEAIEARLRAQVEAAERRAREESARAEAERRELEARFQEQVRRAEERARAEAARADAAREEAERAEAERKKHEEALAAARKAGQWAELPETVQLASGTEARTVEVAAAPPVVAAPVEIVSVPVGCVPGDVPEWASLLSDDGARRVFLHLAAHGSITDHEVTGFLGSPRAYRRFALEFEAHARNVPFRVRIEPLADGKRYVKEGES